MSKTSKNAAMVATESESESESEQDESESERAVNLVDIRDRLLGRAFADNEFYKRELRTFVQEHVGHVALVRLANEKTIAVFVRTIAYDDKTCSIAVKVQRVRMSDGALAMRRDESTSTMVDDVRWLKHSDYIAVQTQKNDGWKAAQDARIEARRLAKLAEKQAMGETVKTRKQSRIASDDDDF